MSTTTTTTQKKEASRMSTTTTTTTAPEEVMRLAGYVVSHCKARAGKDGYTSTWYADNWEDAVQTAALAYYEYQAAPTECGLIYYMCRAVGREEYRWTRRGNPDYIARNWDPSSRTYDIDAQARADRIYARRIYWRSCYLASTLRRDFRARVVLAVEAILGGSRTDSPRAMAAARAIIRQAIQDVHNGA